MKEETRSFSGGRSPFPYQDELTHIARNMGKDNFLLAWEKLKPRPQRVRGKLMEKIPMSNRVITVDGECWSFWKDIRENKLYWAYEFSIHIT